MKKTRLHDFWVDEFEDLDALDQEKMRKTIDKKVLSNKPSISKYSQGYLVFFGQMAKYGKAVLTIPIMDANKRPVNRITVEFDF